MQLPLASEVVPSNIVPELLGRPVRQAVRAVSILTFSTLIPLAMNSGIAVSTAEIQSRVVYRFVRKDCRSQQCTFAIWYGLPEAVHSASGIRLDEKLEDGHTIITEL